MNNRKIALRVSTLIAAMALPLSVWAHPGIGDHASFAMGVAHPLTGLDHLLAMVALALWAARMPSTRLPTILGVTSLAVLAGVALGVTGVGLALAETGLALSVVLFGLLVVAGSRLSFHVAIAIVASFATLHGYAHGVELPAISSGIAFLSGFALSSLALTAGTYFIARLALLSRALALPAGGAAIALMGVSMFIAT